MRRIDLDSDTLAWASYSHQTLVLELGFRNGSMYAYFDVPSATFDQLLQADSKGRYFNHHIRNSFRAQLVPLSAARGEN